MLLRNINHGKCFSSFFLTFFAFQLLKNCISTDPCFEYIKCDPKNGCSCGIENKDAKGNTSKAQSRIINGKPSLEHKYPWIVHIQKTVTLAYPVTMPPQKASSNHFI